MAIFRMMEDTLIRQLKKRRTELHRRIQHLHVELRDLESRADELEKVWREVSRQQPSKPQWALPPLAQIDKGVPRNAGGLILYALQEFERSGLEGIDRETLMQALRMWLPHIKSNTARVTFKRLVDSGKIKKFGNLYRPSPELAGLPSSQPS